MTGAYDIEDLGKIQGRDEVVLGSRDLGELRLARCLRALEPVDGSILLLGSGAGRYARALERYRPDLEVLAGDLSSNAVREAVDLGGGPSYMVLDAQHLPFADEIFGAVVFFDLLEHVPFPQLMLAECARVTAPDGVLHFFVPLEGQPGTLYHLLRGDRPVPIHRWKHAHVGHLRRFRRSEVIAEVWRAGFEVTHVESSFHLVGQIHDVVDYWHRERLTGADGLLPLAAVNVITRGLFVLTWRGAWVEDRLYAGPRCASGLHVTARRIPPGESW